MSYDGGFCCGIIATAYIVFFGSLLFLVDWVGFLCRGFCALFVCVGFEGGRGGSFVIVVYGVGFFRGVSGGIG